jgi:hypothetical protein
LIGPWRKLWGLFLYTSSENDEGTHKPKLVLRLLENQAFCIKNTTFLRENVLFGVQKDFFFVFFFVLFDFVINLHSKSPLIDTKVSPKGKK